MIPPKPKKPTKTNPLIYMGDGEYKFLSDIRPFLEEAGYKIVKIKMVRIK